MGWLDPIWPGKGGVAGCSDPIWLGKVRAAGWGGLTLDPIWPGKAGVAGWSDPIWLGKARAAGWGGSTLDPIWPGKAGETGWLVPIWPGKAGVAGWRDPIWPGKAGVAGWRDPIWPGCARRAEAVTQLLCLPATNLPHCHSWIQASRRTVSLLCQHSESKTEQIMFCITDSLFCSESCSVLSLPADRNSVQLVLKKYYLEVEL